MKNLFTAVAKNSCIFIFYFLLPVLPLLLTIAFAKPKFFFNYRQTLRKLIIYVQALREGPLEHYFQDVIGLENEVPATIEGSCIKCGNCCLNKRCVFLEQTSQTEFQCGIYTSPFRRFSNCNSFPLNAQDIARYDCPSYFVSQQTPYIKSNNEREYAVNWMKPTTYPNTANISEIVGTK